MKSVTAITLAFALATSVSGLAFAATELPTNYIENAATLVAPPPPAVKYTPSVPAPAVDAVVQAAQEPADTAYAATPYVPSVPTPEEAADATAAPVVTPPAIPYIPSIASPEESTEVTTPTPATASYTPSVPAIKAPPIPAEAPLTAPVAEAAESPEIATEKMEQPAYTPSVPAYAAEEKPATENLRTATIGSELNDALAKAYNFNPELKSFRSRLKSIDEQIPQAYAGWLPTASADYSYGYEKQKASGTQLNGTHPESKSLSVTQPVFNGGETLARTSRAFNAVTVGRAQLTDAEQQTLTDAVKVYIDVVRTDEILQLSVHNENVLKEQLQATQDRFKLGETTRTDVAQSQARLARATSDKVRAAGNYDVAKANYLRVIGEAPKNVGMPTQLPEIPRTLEEAMAMGLKKDPRLIAADVTRELADDDIDIAQAALLPDVSLRGSLERQDGLSSRSGQSLDSDSVTINASIPIFQSGAEYSRVRQGKRTRQQRREEYDATRDQTIESVTSRWRDIETARASIVSNRAAVESASVALNGVRQEADVGTRTTLDVLDAEQELFLAKVNLVTAKAQEVVAVYALHAATGSLTAQDLALNVQVYDPTEHEKSVKYRVIGF